ncbi:MAG: hypothetical protein E7464_05735 [Ruminococcaceae bacterium]|nr:hypothetical protein [Oscillospiraceae bacterium]
MKRRIIAFSLAVCLLYSLFPITALAVEADVVGSGEFGASGNNLKWMLDSLGTMTISGNGKMVDDTQSQFSNPPWYDLRYQVKQVVIESGVKDIGKSAFLNCSNLVSISIPNSIINIGDDAFKGCSSLGRILLPVELKSIGKNAFWSCSSLTIIEIPYSVSEIQEKAFKGCTRLSVIFFEGDLPIIKDDAFGGVTATCYYPAENTNWSDLVKQNYGGTLEWLAQGTSPIYVASGTCGEEVEWALDMEGTLTISGEGAMENTSSNERPWHGVRNSITAVVIENGITVISNNAFYDCNNLNYVTISDSVISIGDSAFSNCGKLEKVIIGNNVTTIGEYAFTRCTSLTDIIIPNSVVGIDTEAFSYCFGLIDLTIGNGVKYIGYQAFISCDSLVSVVLPDSVTTIGESAFAYCEKITNLTIGESVDKISHWAFAFCESLNDVKIPDSVTTIESQAFYNCSSLVNLDIGSSISTITFGTFANCDNLTTVRIPDSVSSIEDCAFAECVSLGEIVFCGDAPFMGKDVFRYVTAIAYYPYDHAFWTESMMQNYGGRITWTQYTPDDHEHAYADEITTPSCTEKGYTTFVCSCGDTYIGNEVPALGHSFGEWEVVTPATGTSEGEELRECSGCGLEERRATEKLTHSFVDVPAGAFYENPVLWAVAKGITSGTSDGSTFSPNMICTRAQVVTFLWRAAGSPEPISTANPFTDIVEGSYYYKAVLWAVENEITSGTGNGTTFSPDMECTRAQVATFLWRTAGKPAAESSTHPFRDILAGSYYYDAVLWAVEAGVTNGTGDGSTFSPDKSCTRAEIVTFLHRAIA